MVRLTASSPSVRLVIKRLKRDEKAEYGEPDIRNPVEQVAKVSVSEAVSEASSRETCLPWLIGRPKREGILGYAVNRSVVTIPPRYRRKAATYGHEPINLRNGVTR